MPSRIHEAFVAFGNDICDQLFESQFLPSRYKRNNILQTGSVDFNYGTSIMAPDASVSFFGAREPFLVLEVAFSEKEEHAQRKAQDYILSSNGAITFVVLVVVNKRLRSKSTSAGPPTTCPPKDEDLSADHDTVHIHVYKSEIIPASDTQPNATLTGKHILNKLQIFPGPAPNETFDITWPDINRGTWSNFCKNAHLPFDARSPVCTVNFLSLVSIARSLAGKSDDSSDGTPLYLPDNSRNVQTPILQKRKFVDSPSPIPYLSNGSSGSSDEGRRRDPNYPSPEGSSDSFNSC